ncbi:glycine--tRNA ligase [Trifolium repens]|nr:glycine--tRNA ligase [Trifolium repens]
MQDKSGVKLVAHEKISEPKEVEKLVITPIKKELGLAFKGNQKKVVEALEETNERSNQIAKGRIMGGQVA